MASDEGKKDNLVLCFFHHQHQEDLKNEKKTYFAILSGALWTTDIALTTLLVFLLIYIFFLYPLGPDWCFQAFDHCVLVLILITGTITASRNRIFKDGWFSHGGLLTFVFPVDEVFVSARGSHLRFQLSVSLLPVAPHLSYFEPGFFAKGRRLPIASWSSGRLSDSRDDMVLGL